MYRVLGRATSGNVQKVTWLMEELGADYVREDFGRQFGNTADARYLEMNPTGKVPTLVDGDVVVWESNTILRYVCAREKSSFHPADLAARAQAESWMDWQLASLNGPYLEVFREARKAPDERGDGTQTLVDALCAQLSLLDARLSDRAYLSGDGPGIADFCLGPVVHRCLGFPLTLAPLENLRRWHAAYAARPGFAKTFHSA